jgi:hypothetical protein
LAWSISTASVRDLFFDLNLERFFITILTSIYQFDFIIYLFIWDFDVVWWFDFLVSIWALNCGMCDHYLLLLRVFLSGILLKNSIHMAPIIRWNMFAIIHYISPNIKRILLQFLKVGLKTYSLDVELTLVWVRLILNSTQIIASEGWYFGWVIPKLGNFTRMFRCHGLDSNRFGNKWL